MSKSTLNIIGIFDDEDKLLGSIKSIQSKGISIGDVITPYPIHGVIEALKLKTRIPYAALLYGIFAVAVTFAFLYWTSVVNYPLRFGGKPQNTLSFVVVIFVMTINITALFTIVTFFVRENKGPGKVPDIVHKELTNDRYAILIRQKEGMTADDLSNINSLLKESGAIEIMQKEVKP